MDRQEQRIRQLIDDSHHVAGDEAGESAGVGAMRGTRRAPERGGEASTVESTTGLKGEGNGPVFGQAAGSAGRRDAAKEVAVPAAAVPAATAPRRAGLPRWLPVGLLAEGRPAAPETVSGRSPPRSKSGPAGSAASVAAMVAVRVRMGRLVFVGDLA